MKGAIPVPWLKVDDQLFGPLIGYDQWAEALDIEPDEYLSLFLGYKSNRAVPEYALHDGSRLSLLAAMRRVAERHGFARPTAPAPALEGVTA